MSAAILLLVAALAIAGCVADPSLLAPDGPAVYALGPAANGPDSVAPAH